MPVDKGPTDATVDGRGFVFVVNGPRGTVTKVDVAKRKKLRTSPTLGAQPNDITFDRGSNRLVVPTRPSAVALVDPTTLAPKGTVPSSPALASAAIDPGTCRVWMLDYSYHRIWSVPYTGGAGSRPR